MIVSNLVSFYLSTLTTSKIYLVRCRTFTITKSKLRYLVTNLVYFLTMKLYMIASTAWYTSSVYEVKWVIVLLAFVIKPYVVSLPASAAIRITLVKIRENLITSRLATPSLCVPILITCLYRTDKR